MSRVEFKIPDRVPSDFTLIGDELTRAVSLPYGPPTEVSGPPDFGDTTEPEEDVLLDLDESVDAAPTTKIEVRSRGPTEPPPTTAPDRSPRFFERLKRSAALQLGVLSSVGLALSLFLFDGGGESKDTPDVVPHRTFPTIDIEGAPPVTVKDIERRLLMTDPAAQLDPVEELQAKRAKLKALAAEQRERAGVDPLPERTAPKRRLLSAGNSRPGGDGASPRGLDVSERRVARHFYEPGGTMKVEGADESPKTKMLPLSVGDRLFAKLEVGISSGHAAPVLARLAKEVRASGQLVAPKGAIIKGRFQADGDKVYATFHELLVGPGESLSFEGYAIDHKVPGLVATRREIEGGAGESVIEETVDVARGVMRSVASGSIVGQVAQGVAEGVLPDEKTKRTPGVILEVAAGKRFQIVVTKGGDA